MHNKELLVSSGSFVYTGSCFSGIYGHQCHLNSKWYVGESIHVPIRVRVYITEKMDGQHVIKRAIEKYTIQEFSCYKLEECAVEILHEREFYWGTTLNSLSPHGYNLRIGGSGKCATSAETIEKIRAAKIGKKRVFSPEHIDNIRRGARRGKGIRKLSSDTKRKMSLARMGQKHTLGYKHTEETKKKIGKSVKKARKAARLKV